MIRDLLRWCYWRARAAWAERGPSGPIGSALARFWVAVWVHPGRLFAWLAPADIPDLSGFIAPMPGIGPLVSAAGLKASCIVRADATATAPLDGLLSHIGGRGSSQTEMNAQVFRAVGNGAQAEATNHVAQRQLLLQLLKDDPLRLSDLQGAEGDALYSAASCTTRRSLGPDTVLRWDGTSDRQHRRPVRLGSGARPLPLRDTETRERTEKW